MTAPDPICWLDEGRDPTAELFEGAKAAGWCPVPQIAIGGTDAGLMRRTSQQYVDVLTLPLFGLATVVRLRAAINPERPRDTVEEWRHQVSAMQALSWAVSGSDTDDELNWPEATP